MTSLAATRVKICGLTNAEDAAHAVRSGADYLGFVFAQSPRQADPAEVERWLDGVRGEAEVVGVFRDAPIDQVRELIERLDLDLVQLHGSETGSDWATLPVRVIETRHVDRAEVAPSRLSDTAWADLLEPASARGGGCGKSFPWEAAAPIARGRRVFLAGGLSPHNVRAAIATVRPFAVDVSSGVELSPGRKDHRAVAEFIVHAKTSPAHQEPQAR